MQRRATSAMPAPYAQRQKHGRKKSRRLDRRLTGDVKNNRESNYQIDPTTPSWRRKIKANLNPLKKD
jgi:hypothetical protein